MRYIANSFSVSMLPEGGIVEIKELPQSVAAQHAALPHVSCVGHTDTAAALSTELGAEIACNRQAITLEPGDMLIVAQLQGGRLPEGSTTLPEGFSFRFYGVRLVPAGAGDDQLAEQIGELEDTVARQQRRITQLEAEARRVRELTPTQFARERSERAQNCASWGAQFED